MYILLLKYKIYK